MAPNSCLRTECIPFSWLRLLAIFSPNSCLRTECIFGQACFERGMANSKLMSPHGMHLHPDDSDAHEAASQLMSPHGMHR